MRCEHTAFVKEGFYKGTMARLEYDNLWAFGPNVGVDQPNFVIKAAERCNFYGLDATSVGVTIAFVMECFEKGLVTAEELGGVDARFGNANAVIQLIDRIGKREGAGAWLADGVKAAAEKIGKNSIQYAMQIKGLEASGYDLRSLKTTALAAAVSFRGADHARSGVYSVDFKGSVDRLKAEMGRGKIVVDNEDICNLLDSFIVCKNAKGTFDEQFADLAKLYSTVTGFEVTAEDMRKAADRIQTLAKLINMKFGFTRKDDSLPWKILNKPVSDDGPSKGAVVAQTELDLMLDDYYEARGWDKQGAPTSATVKALGLEQYAKEA
jgi:aldehyde:ferredoxin oxidoreductase